MHNNAGDIVSSINVSVILVSFRIIHIVPGGRNAPSYKGLNIEHYVYFYFIYLFVF